MSSKRPKVTISVESRLTFAQKLRILINRRKDIRRRNERLKRRGNEKRGMEKSSKTAYNRSPNIRVRKFYIFHECYFRDQALTLRIKIDCKCRETAQCYSCGSCIWVLGE